MAANSTVHQFKVTLKGTDPPIWRRIQVPSTYNFYELHCALQDAMGWKDAHCHQFNMKNPQGAEEIYIGEPSTEFSFTVIPEQHTKITKYFVQANDKALYEYDFGDSWKHEVILESIIPSETNVKYPRCVAGELACPPEDAGGTHGYYELLKVIADPKHKEYKEKMEWLRFIGFKKYEPEKFDPSNVRFKNTASHRRCQPVACVERMFMNMRVNKHPFFEHEEDDSD